MFFEPKVLQQYYSQTVNCQFAYFAPLPFCSCVCVCVCFLNVCPSHYQRREKWGKRVGEGSAQKGERERKKLQVFVGAVCVCVCGVGEWRLLALLTHTPRIRPRRAQCCLYVFSLCVCADQNRASGRERKETANTKCTIGHWKKRRGKENVKCISRVPRSCLATWGQLGPGTNRIADLPPLQIAY